MTPNDHDPAGDDPVIEPIAEPLRPASAPTWAPADTVSAPARADAVQYSTRSAGPGKLRAGVVAGAAVALAVGAVATSMAATPTPSGTTATTSALSGATTGAAGIFAAPFLVTDPVVGGVDETFDHGRMGRMGFNDITISAINGSSITLKTDDGWTRTVTVTDSVTLTKGGQEIAVAELAVGDEVRLSQTRNADGTYTVNGIAVVVPSVSGTVSDVSSTGFKVTTRDGSVWTITVNGTTEYRYGTGDGSLSDVTNGTTVVVLGESAGDNALTALTVQVAGDHVAGTVKSKTSDTIVITRRDGTTVTIHVDGDTTYRVEGVESADLGDVAVDMAIGVSGRARSDGSIDADTVDAGTGHIGFGDKADGFDGGFGGGRGGRGGFGPGMGPDHMDDAAPTASPSTSS